MPPRKNLRSFTVRLVRRARSIDTLECLNLLRMSHFVRHEVEGLSMSTDACWVSALQKKWEELGKTYS